MNFVICDDNVKEIVVIRRILEESFSGCSVEEFYEGGSIMKFLEHSVPDVVLLDVEMPGINGIETARKIRESYPYIGIIFITGHTEYALEAFSVYAFDYLVKPVNRERLVYSVEKVTGRTSLTEKFIEIHSKGTVFRVNQKDIIFVEKTTYKSYIYTEKFIYTMRATLRYFLERLDPEVFIRTHMGYIVNRDKISSITSKGNMAYDIHFYSTDRVAPLSRGMNKTLKLV